MYLKSTLLQVTGPVLDLPLSRPDAAFEEIRERKLETVLYVMAANKTGKRNRALPVPPTAKFVKVGKIPLLTAGRVLMTLTIVMTSTVQRRNESRQL